MSGGFNIGDPVILDHGEGLSSTISFVGPMLSGKERRCPRAGDAARLTPRHGEAGLDRLVTIRDIAADGFNVLADRDCFWVGAERIFALPTREQALEAWKLEVGLGGTGENENRLGHGCTAHPDPSAQLATEIYEAAIANNEDLREDGVGIDVAYTMGAALRGTPISWRDCGQVFRDLALDTFPEGHDFWRLRWDTAVPRKSR